MDPSHLAEPEVRTIKNAILYLSGAGYGHTATELAQIIDQHMPPELCDAVKRLGNYQVSCDYLVSHAGMHEFTGDYSHLVIRWDRA